MSLRPGEAFTLHASSTLPHCRLQIARVGAERRVVFEAPLNVGDHPTPDEADRNGCGWPAAAEVTVGADWAAGYHDIVLTDAKGEAAHHFICVRAPSGKAGSRMVLVLATNTLHAYNYWGGRSAYCDVGALMSRRLALPEAMAGALGVLSTQRPFPPLLLAPPPELPRLVNLKKRGFQERSWAGADPAWSRANGQSPYDGSAGFLNKWEHAFVRWAEAEGLALDYLTDRDLDMDPAALDPYDVVVLVGHSEYWSGPQREGIDAFLDRGGRLAIFSGNTAFWKVRWEDDGQTLICHKWKGFEADPRAEAAPKDGAHLWSHPAFGRPEASTTGLSFIFGGYHRLGLCAARGQGGYTVYRPNHWALAGCDLYYGDVFGDEVPLVGYENDGCPITFDEEGLPAPLPRLGVPETLEIIALTPASFAEAPSPYRPLIPPERLDVVAEIAFGSPGPAAQARVLRGHAVLAAFKRGAGEVFNAGTTEWAHGLAAGDPFVTRITKNVLERFLG
ncbi:MAG TPA: N,N-dimethylformamidase beta subunit family domain-containing protein [Caulobacteraceae bacterium]|nr:N,N-dimethylformamidase beta subunit family domain-containing protein [Caulobacteraceae bacterium]